MNYYETFEAYASHYELGKTRDWGAIKKDREAFVTALWDIIGDDVDRDRFDEMLRCFSPTYGVMLEPDVFRNALNWERKYHAGGYWPIDHSYALNFVKTEAVRRSFTRHASDLGLSVRMWEAMQVWVDTVEADEDDLAGFRNFLRNEMDVSITFNYTVQYNVCDEELYQRVRQWEADYWGWDEPLD